MFDKTEPEALTPTIDAAVAIDCVTKASETADVEVVKVASDVAVVVDCAASVVEIVLTLVATAVE